TTTPAAQWSTPLRGVGEVGTTTPQTAGRRKAGRGSTLPAASRRSLGCPKQGSRHQIRTVEADHEQRLPVHPCCVFLAQETSAIGCGRGEGPSGGLALLGVRRLDAALDLGLLGCRAAP